MNEQQEPTRDELVAKLQRTQEALKSLGRALKEAGAALSESADEAIKS